MSFYIHCKTILLHMQIDLRIVQLTAPRSHTDVNEKKKQHHQTI